MDHTAPKKPQGQELTGGEKCCNRLVSRVRVVVAPGSAGGNRCRRVKEVVRWTTQGISAVVLEMAGGLHHLRVSCRHPLPALDVLSWVNST